MGTYKETISEPGVFDIANANKLLIEPHGNLVDAAFAHFWDDEMNYNIEPHGQQENQDSIDHSENIEESNSIGETDSTHSIDFTITT